MESIKIRNDKIIFMKINKIISISLSAAMVAMSLSVQNIASAHTEIESEVLDLGVNYQQQEGQVEDFSAEAHQISLNKSILTLEGATFELQGGDLVALSESGEIIENLSQQIENVPGVSFKYLSEKEVMAIIDSSEYPELQLKCGISALSGGVAAMVATGIGLAALGVTTGGAGLVALALASAAGYGGGAVAGDCFD